MATKRAKADAGAVTKKETTLVQEALQTTFILKGTLKRVQLMYLRVGELLVKVRDEKLYEALKHPDMESYARERLGLGRSSLFNYLRIYDWVTQFHSEWLKPKAKGFMPDLSDVGDLMWLDAELAKTGLTAARRALLEKLKKDGLAGKLSRSEMHKVRKSDNTVEDSLQHVISKLKLIRRRAAELAHMSPEVIGYLDAAIQILVADKALTVAQLESWKSAKNGKWRGNFLS